MADPAITSRLEAIERDLATRMPVYEDAARKWYRAKRDREKAHAEAFVKAEGSVAAREAEADITTATMGRNEEAEYEALKAVIRVLEARASIGQSLLRASNAADQMHAVAA